MIFSENRCPLFPIMLFPFMLNDKRLLQTRDFVEVKLGAALPGE
jgi:hypothetical protein